MDLEASKMTKLNITKGEWKKFNSPFTNKKMRQKVGPLLLVNPVSDDEIELVKQAAEVYQKCDMTPEELLHTVRHLKGALNDLLDAHKKGNEEANRDPSAQEKTYERAAEHLLKNLENI